MDLGPLTAALDQESPSRDTVMEQLDIVTDPLRGGFPTTPLVHQLLTLFTRLISFSHWHIQQDALSCVKYIFVNSTLNREQKKEALQKHTDLTKQLGVLLGDRKREVREMAAQCIGHLAIQVGPALLDDEFGLNVLREVTDACALEGQQMALGRLATAFRIVAPEKLDILLNGILKDEQFSKLTSPSDNGYVVWYSTRALLLFVTAKLDAVLEEFLHEFTMSHQYVMETFRETIEKCARQRYNHHYTNVRRTAGLVIGELFTGLETGREEYIDSLIPAAGDKWVSREGAFLAIEACIEHLKKPLSAEYVETLCKKLADFVRDPTDSDPAPANQKGNANAKAARALVAVLVKHDKALFDKYVHDAVMFLLEAPYAVYIDGGLMCLSKLKEMGGFQLDDLYLRAFKNIGHASAPICDLAKRTVPAALLVEKSFEELVDVIVKFGSSSDAEVRESVCKSLQMISSMTDKQLPHTVAGLAESLISDDSESVSAAALEVLACLLDETSAKKVPGIVKNILTSDADHAILAAIKLLKASLVLFRDAVISDVYGIAPLLAFHTITSMTPAVSTQAQQLLVLMAGDKGEADEGIIQKVKDMDIDGLCADELGDAVDACHNNEKAPASMLEFVIRRFCEDLGVANAEEALQQVCDNKMTKDELIAYICGEEKAEVVGRLAMLLTMSETLTPEQLKRTMQVLADVFADDRIDFDEKRPLLIALDAMRRKPAFAGDKFFAIPDPTPISKTHHQEGFTK